MKGEPAENCPDCGSEMVWHEESGQYLHLDEEKFRRCWLGKDEVDPVS